VLRSRIAKYLIIIKLLLAVGRIVSMAQPENKRLVEHIMERNVTQPTKEQVRAYMARRERARRPPPAPEDIRRQLGWKLGPPEPGFALINLCLLPATLGQIAAQTAFELLLSPLRAQSNMAQSARIRV
jgi:hypothetical protein